MKYSLDKLETNRLRFRKLSQSDFDWWLEFFKDSERIKYLFLPKGTPEQQCQNWIDKIQERYRTGTGGMHVVELKESGQPVGQCALHIQVVDDKKEFEIGYSFLSISERKGYATEAAKAVRDFAFEQDFTDHLISIIHRDNLPSISVAERNGMHFWKETTFRDKPVNIYKLSKNDWLNLYS